MRRVDSLRDRPIYTQAKGLAEEVYRVTFKPSFQAHETLTDRLRRLTVTIANALDEAREQDACQVVRACDGTRRTLAELREACQLIPSPELQPELRPIAERCTVLEQAFGDLAQAIESGNDSASTES